MRNPSGKMPERSIGTVSKTVVPLRVPRVRIPVFPQPGLISGIYKTNAQFYTQKCKVGCFYGYLTPAAHPLVSSVRFGYILPSFEPALMSANVATVF